jgi:hypothetical protein
MAILLDRGRHARKKDQQNDRNFKRNEPLDGKLKLRADDDFISRAIGQNI